VQSVEVKVDSALIEQLRAGYAEMNAPGSSRAKLVGGGDTLVEYAASSPSTCLSVAGMSRSESMCRTLR
jgi:hypothetical protein